MTLSDYANRVEEFKQLSENINSDTDIILLKAREASGLTSFLDRVSHYNFLEYKTLLVAATTKGSGVSLSEEILNTILIQTDKYDELSCILQKESDVKYGESDTSIINTVIQKIPQVGELISGIIGFFAGKKAASIYTGKYGTLLESFLVPALTKAAKRQKYLIIIDSLNALNEQSIELTIQLSKIYNIKIVASLIYDADNSTKTENKIRNSQAELKQIMFPAPEGKLIRELAEFKNVEINDQQVDELQRLARGNIHTIISYFLEKGDEPISSLSRYLIQILYLCHRGINLDFLKLAVRKNTTLFLNSFDTDIDESLVELKSRDVIRVDGSQHDEFYFLGSSTHPMIINSMNEIDLIVAKKFLYETFSESKFYEGDLFFTELFLKLSLDYNAANSSNIAKNLLRMKLVLGERILEEELLCAKFDDLEDSDIMLKVICFTREKRYEDALKEIVKFRAKDDRDYQVLYAILLNRCRQHEFAHYQLSDLIMSSNHLDEKAILSAYLVVNYVHSNKVDEALEFYNEMKPQLSNSVELGYFIRNSGVLFDARAAVHQLQEAASIFERNGDHFGYYTTLANMGKYYCSVGELLEATEKLQQAQKGLEAFGLRHVSIVSNNLGILHGILGNFPEAYKQLEYSQSTQSNAMPRIFAQINIACILLKENKTAAARDIFERLEPEIIHYPVRRVLQQYYTNRLMLEFIDYDPQRFDKYLGLCLNHPNRFNGRKTIQLTEDYKSMDREGFVFDDAFWLRMFSPCYLEYWYIDPLKLIRRNIIEQFVPVQT